MTSRSSNGRRRAAALALAAGLSVAAFGAPSGAGVAAPSQDPSGADLKAEYDEVIGREAELLTELSEAQAARREAADQLLALERQTRDKQLELLAAHEALEEAERTADRRAAAVRRATRRVADGRERLRQQIVAAYVSGGEDTGLLEAFLRAEDGEQIGQALAYGRAAANSTEALVAELEAAQELLDQVSRDARRAERSASNRRDDLAAAASFLVGARERQEALLTDLNFQVLAEAEALRAIQGRKALVEGRINSMNRTSDGVALLLAAVQADQPDWEPGAMEITTPVPGVQPSSSFGQRAHPILGITRLHAGADLGVPTGTPIYAVADGTVLLAEVRGGYGNTVVIDHGNSMGTLSAHNSQLLVEPGDEVLRGEVIALAGSTGLSTGPHLHFETRIKGMPIDPEGVIDFAREVDYEALAALRD